MSNFACSAYTEKIANGEITNGRDFLELCLRNFGVMSKYRDRPIGIIKPDFDSQSNNSYISNAISSINDAQEDLKKHMEIPIHDYHVQLIATMQDNLDQQVSMLTEAINFKNELEHIESEIKSWLCDEEFENIKKFALQQIDNAKDSLFIDSIKGRIQEYTEEINKLTADDGESHAKDLFDAETKWYQNLIDDLNDALENERKNTNHSKSKEFYDRFINSINTIQ